VRPDVLVVEDDADVREALADALADVGYRVAQAPGGDVALARLREGLRPRMILLDLMMPGVDGWAFRRQQAADSALAGIPVMVLTARCDASMEGVRVLVKPIDFRRLVAEVGELCGNPVRV
jgi:CheY-like chemotaxis protein